MDGLDGDGLDGDGLDGLDGLDGGEELRGREVFVWVGWYNGSKFWVVEGSVRAVVSS